MRPSAPSKSKQEKQMARHKKGHKKLTVKGAHLGMKHKGKKGGRRKRHGKKR